MKTFTKLFTLLLAVSIFATSCNKEDETKPDNPIEEEKDYNAVPFSATITLSPMQGGFSGVELKQTFVSGDVVEITNPDVLYEPLSISADEFAGKSTASFSGELKVKKGAEPSKLTAVLKNGDNYNGGKPYNDVKQLESTANDINKYSYWSCENFDYSASNTSVNLVQSTVFVEFNIPFTVNVNIKNGQAVFNTIIQGKGSFAVPNGATVECADFQKDVVLKDKLFYSVSAQTPENCLPGLFSIAENKQIFFSKGNLQYLICDGTWRLAPYQYHTCFDDFMFDIGDDYADYPGPDNWTDLFWWGAWIDGVSHSKAGKYTEDYIIPIGADGNISGKCAFGEEWTVLSADEWNYLMFTRPNADKKQGGAIVAGVQGWIILPNNWIEPEGIKPFEARFDVKYKEDIPNQYTKEEWEKMEAAGAVFLPFTGSIWATYITKTTNDYQTRTYAEGDIPQLIDFSILNSSAGTEEDGMAVGFGFHFGYPIRLIQYFTPSVKVE